MAHGNIVQSILDVDGEYQELTADQQHVWLVICVTPLGGKSGLIQKGSLSILARQCKRDIATVRDAISRFIEFGWIVEDEANNLWVRNRVKHRCNSNNWRQGAFREALEFQTKSPILSQQCIEYHSLTAAPPRKGGPGGLDEKGFVKP